MDICISEEKETPGTQHLQKGEIIHQINIEYSNTEIFTTQPHLVSVIEMGRILRQ